MEGQKRQSVVHCARPLEKSAAGPVMMEMQMLEKCREKENLLEKWAKMGKV